VSRDDRGWYDNKKNIQSAAVTWGREKKKKKLERSKENGKNGAS
jgi:hypothetical protein